MWLQDKNIPSCCPPFPPGGCFCTILTSDMQLIWWYWFSICAISSLNVFTSCEGTHINKGNTKNEAGYILSGVGQLYLFQFRSVALQTSSTAFILGLLFLIFRTDLLLEHNPKCHTQYDTNMVFDVQIQLKHCGQILCHSWCVRT